MIQDGLPGTRLVQGAMIVLVLGAVLGIYLLIAPPTLPYERERTGGAPPPGTSAPGDGRPSGGSAPAAAPGTAAPQSGGDVPAASPAPSASPQPAQRHTIRQGDTLLAIAEQYDTTVDAIRAANPGLNETALPVGQEITIPAGR